jgi:proteic killer suppression protein
VPAQFIPRLERMLDRLDEATQAGDMNLPGYGFHLLQGSRWGTYASSVSGNWRLTFRFSEGDATHVDLEDYH